MAKLENDIDLVRINKERGILKQVALWLFSEDRTICQSTGGHVYLFLNASPTAKSTLLKREYELVSDIEEILEDEESIFFRGPQKQYFKIQNCEDIHWCLDLIRNYCIDAGKMAIVEDSGEGFIETQNCFNHSFKEKSNSICDIIYLLSDEENHSVGHKAPKILSSTDYNNASNALPVHRRQDDPLSHRYPLIKEEDVSLKATKVRQSRDYNYESYTHPVHRRQDDPPSHRNQYQPSQPERGEDEKQKTIAVGFLSRPNRSNQKDEKITLDCPTSAKRPAKHPDYIDEVQRRSSFSYWSYGEIQDPKVLVRNGFFYTGPLDLVRCFQCGLGLKDFSNDDDSLLEHIRYAENCDFLVDLIGGEKLYWEKARLEQSDPTYQRKLQWDKIQSGQYNAATSPPPGRHPCYSALHSRLKTFETWPRTSCKKPMELAKAGFFYTENGDLVRCWFCDGGFQNWDPMDDPWVEHCRWFPSCHFAYQEKGEQFIRLVQQATESGNERTLLAEVEKMRVIQETTEAEGSNMQAVSRQEGAVGSDENTNSFVVQLKEMGYDANIVKSAVASLARKGNHQPDILSVIDEIHREEGKRGSTREHRTAESLRRENEMLKNKMICMKCRARNREALFLPCKHLRMCMSCSENQFRCPVCEQPIIHKIKTYMP